MGENLEIVWAKVFNLKSGSFTWKQMTTSKDENSAQISSY